MIGVLSDIHSNFEALKTVVDFFTTEGVKEVVCCGDVVGYGPDPERCIELIQKIGAKTVAGNHDWAAIGKTSIKDFNPLAAVGVRWTGERLNSQERDFLAYLPLFSSLGPLYFVHSAPSQPQRWKYIFTLKDAEDEFKNFTTRICLIGHTHIPFIIEENQKSIKEFHFLSGERIELDKNNRYLINVGSVGQPRDGDPRACCALIEESGNWVSFHRLNYDFTITQKKILLSGLPPQLAYRLAYGR